MVKVGVLARTEYGRQIEQSLKEFQKVLDDQCSCPDKACSVVLTELPNRCIEAVIVRPRPVAESRDWSALSSTTGEYRKVFERRAPVSRIRDSVATIIGAPLVGTVSLPPDELLEWNPSFSVGLGELDEHHKQLLEMINKLQSASPVNVRSELISEILGALTWYARQHFEMEESLLELHGYPELDDQKEEHRKFRFAVAMMCVDATRHEESVPADLLRFLKEWWTRHILEKDMKYRSFFSERGIS